MKEDEVRNLHWTSQCASSNNEYDMTQETDHDENEYATKASTHGT